MRQRKRDEMKREVAYMLVVNEAGDVEHIICKTKTADRKCRSCPFKKECGRCGSVFETWDEYCDAIKGEEER